jgi:hypothetical protein
MWRYKFTDVSKEPTKSIFRTKQQAKKATRKKQAASRAVSSALKMEAICPSETSVNLYQNTVIYNPDDYILHSYRLENLVVFLLFMPCSWECRHLGGTFRNIKPWRWNQHLPPKRRYSHRSWRFRNYISHKRLYPLQFRKLRHCLFLRNVGIYLKPEDGDITFLRNIDILLQNYTMSQPSTLHFEQSQPWKLGTYMRQLHIFFLGRREQEILITKLLSFCKFPASAGRDIGQTR